jgi:CheY-like chemotaxis protein
VKILIADDNERIRKLINKLLNKLNIAIDVIECEDGEEAVNIFSKERPDLILMDIKMKKMDGLTAIKNIRLVSSSVKIIVVSQLPEEEYHKEAISIGADEFINKENLSKLPDMLNEFLKTNNKNM